MPICVFPTCSLDFVPGLLYGFVDLRSFIDTCLPEIQIQAGKNARIHMIQLEKKLSLCPHSLVINKVYILTRITLIIAYNG